MIYQDFLLRIIVTFALSFAIGLERQWRRRVIGLRTNVLVCLGAFLFVSFSFLTDAKDVSRIASQVVCGIGFLGAGLILKDKGNIKILGLAISNGLVALAGCVFAQEERVFEISMGTGAMVIGLASVIIGTSIFRKLTLLRTTTAVLIGSIIYKACVAIALRNFDPQAMKLVTAVLFLIVLIISMERKKKVNTNA